MLRAVPRPRRPKGRSLPKDSDLDLPRNSALSYSRGHSAWYLRPEVHIDIPRAEWEKLSGRAKRLLRFNPVVEDLGQVKSSEGYNKFAF